MIQRIKTIFRKTPTWVKKILLCIVFVMCILHPIKNNLRKYSLYYAQHIPHKDGVYPDIILLMDHFTVIDFPSETNLHREFGGILDTENTRAITLYEESNPTYNSVCRYGQDNYKYVLQISKIRREVYFSWDERGRPLPLSNGRRNPDDPFPQEEDDRLAEKYYKRLTKPIYDVQKEPHINLQWLFNLYYYDRFSRGVK